MKMITIISIALLMASAGALAQASRSKVCTPVQVSASPTLVSMTTTPTPTIESSHTGTGRPADLDPRIPWLDDLGMPQSGGPEPLVKTKEIHLPSIGSVDSLAEIDGLIVFTDGADLYCINMDGNILWNKSMPGPGRWMVLASNHEVYAFPSAIGDIQNSQVNIFSIEGKLKTKIDWPIDAGTEWVTTAAVSQGVLVAEMSSQRRIHARIDVKSTVDPNEIMTVEDVGVGDEDTAESRKNNYKAGYMRVGVNVVDWDYDRKGADRLNEKRRKRAGELRGHKLHISGLPGYAPSAADKDVSRGEWWMPETNLGRILTIELDGSIWTTFSIHNPFHLSREKMDESDARRDVGKMGKPGVALFASDGHLRGYMISDCIARPAGGTVYLLCGEVLVRVEPMKAK